MKELNPALKWCALLAIIVLLTSSKINDKSVDDVVFYPPQTLSKHYNALSEEVYENTISNKIKSNELEIRMHKDMPAKIHAVTDLSHLFSFYSDNRFHAQYLPNHKGVTNWCVLS